MRRTRPWLLLLPIVPLAVLMLVRLPAVGRRGVAVQDLGHIPVAVILALLLFLWLTRVRGLGRGASACVSFVATSAFLGVVELVQPYFYRSRSLQDFLTGALAAGGTVVALHAWRRRGPARVGGLVACLLLFVFAALPAGTELYDDWRQRRDAPMLASFEDDLEMTRWWFAGSRAQRVGDHATCGLYSLRIDLEAGAYPGATMGWPLADWRDYRALGLDLHVDGDEPLELILKVVDETHDGSYEDRFHEHMQLAPGGHSIRIPCARIAEGPSGRELDLGRITGVQLFVNGLERPRTIYIDGLRLMGSR